VKNPVTEKQIRQAEHEAQGQIAAIVRESRSAKEALGTARLELHIIEGELGKRTIPYGGEYYSKRGKQKLQYYRGVPSKILDTKWRVFKDFVEGLEKQLIPKTRREELIMFDRGHTLEELREMCKKKGLVVSGSKKELIARLV